MYSIRNGRVHFDVSDPLALISKLSEQRGSVSVVITKPNGIKSVCYVDVCEGVIRQSYGERRALKAADFCDGGVAFA
jgi:hypothetical protein